MADKLNPFESHYAEAIELLNGGQSPEEVLLHIRRIADEDYRNGTIERLARFFATHGQVQESLLFCHAIDYPLAYADALFEVGRELRKVNLSDSAKSTFRQAVEAAEKLAPNPWDMPALFVQVSEELWGLGEKEEALKLLRRAVGSAKGSPQPFQASKTLAGCVRLLSRWGYRAEALDVADMIESPEQRALVLKELEGPSK